jgi:hypothetical protein
MVTTAKFTLKTYGIAVMKNPAKSVVRAGGGKYRVSQMTGWTVMVTAANFTLNIWTIAEIKNPAKIVVRAVEGSRRNRASLLAPAGDTMRPSR